MKKTLSAELLQKHGQGWGTPGSDSPTSIGGVAHQALQRERAKVFQPGNTAPPHHKPLSALHGSAKTHMQLRWLPHTFLSPDHFERIRWGGWRVGKALLPTLPFIHIEEPQSLKSVFWFFPIPKSSVLLL